KTVNDNLGHECGDRVIIGAANALKKSFGAEHTYRIGGDEFIVVLENLAETELEAYYGAFDEAVRRENEKITGEKLVADDAPVQLKLAVSKGAAFYMPEQDKEYKEVFKRADEEMYKDKERFYRGRNDRRRR
ncbi:MAG: GGDEF domain-containing protein, partial [Lachnospiraceae bacterium]|nr:GGDEF domain-containing protein [Lachnospiraceae bacterium]